MPNIGRKMAPRKMSMAERLAFYSERDPATGCLMWTGMKPRHSPYGRLTVKGITKGAHVWAWETANGRPVPDGMQVCHHCDTPLCIESADLFLGTPGENVADMDAKGRRKPARGERAGNAKLTAARVRAIRADTRPYPAIAEQFGIAVSNVCLIKNRRTWKHI